MATTTPNFGWPVPTSTDLVKDGAVAIEGLGDAIDASLLDLKGGTTGQVLSKASNTDMDFTWVTDAAGDITGVTAGTGISGGGTSGTVTVTNSMATAIDAKGDLIAGTGADTFSRLGVGSNNQVLTADSTTATGLKWATPASGSPSFVGCSVYKISAITFSSGVDTVLNWDAEFFDTNGFHDNSTNPDRITIPSGYAGKYLFTITNRWEPNASGARNMTLFKNGSKLVDYFDTGAFSVLTGLTRTIILDLAVGDYISFKAFQNSGSTLTMYARDYEQPLQVQFLGA